MVKNKVIDVINTFTAEEVNSFELFVKSPFNNSNKSLIKLLQIIKKYIGRTEEKTITEEFLYAKTFPGKKYSYGNMKNMISELFGLCERFLSNTPLINKNGFEFELGLIRLENYSVRMLDKLFFAEYKRLEEKLEYSLLSNDYYLYKSRLTEKLYKFYTRRSQYTGAADTFYPMSIYNTCYIISMLKHDITGMDYLKNQLNYIPKVNLTEALYNNFDSENFIKQLAGLEPVYYNHITLDIKLMKLYNEPDNWGNYSILKEFILKNLSDYSNAEKWHLTSALFGFVLNKYIAGSSRELLMEIAFIRKVQLANVKFNAEGIGPLQAGVLRNMIEAFVLTGEINFAEETISKFITELEEDKRKSIYSYSMALIEESRGNNEKVLEYIRDVEFTDYQAKFSAKMLTMVAFYNLGLIEQGLSAVDSMKHFLKNNEEFSGATKVNLGGRVNVLEKLFKIKANPEKYSQADINDLYEGIHKYIVSKKEWYLEKAEGLKKLIS